MNLKNIYHGSLKSKEQKRTNSTDDQHVLTKYKCLITINIASLTLYFLVSFLHQSIISQVHHKLHNIKNIHPLWVILWSTLKFPKSKFHYHKIHKPNKIRFLVCTLGPEQIHNNKCIQRHSQDCCPWAITQFFTGLLVSQGTRCIALRGKKSEQHRI